MSILISTWLTCLSLRDYLKVEILVLRNIPDFPRYCQGDFLKAYQCQLRRIIAMKSSEKYTWFSGHHHLDHGLRQTLTNRHDIPVQLEHLDGMVSGLVTHDFCHHSPLVRILQLQNGHFPRPVDLHQMEPSVLGPIQKCILEIFFVRHICTTAMANPHWNSLRQMRDCVVLTGPNGGQPRSRLETQMHS